MQYSILTYKWEKPQAFDDDEIERMPLSIQSIPSPLIVFLGRMIDLCTKNQRVLFLSLWLFSFGEDIISKLSQL